ncbi:hypothetical protein MTR67_008401 [Solanum verrucosum]|uniref:Uncharacterized protein n=1 Tax=Solanum verrucosum TaxID=315347 RepID=A0AAF0Q1K1_SOLVR|nr:hypothetical protein MTR67_008401 [Solanum verrucosum]
MLVVRGSPLLPLPKPSSENRLSLDPQADPRAVGQTTICGLCSWIEAPFTQPLSQMTADQRKSPFDPRFRFSASRSRLDRFLISSSA